MSSIRRTFPRNAPPAATLEEMRPMIVSSGSSNSCSMPASSTTSSGNKKASQVKGEHGTGGKFEFSVRDYSDATAKRGFRVQVPKRILVYTILVFFVLPLALFAYMEIIKQSQKRQSNATAPIRKEHPDAELVHNTIGIDSPVVQENVLPPMEGDSNPVVVDSSLESNANETDADALVALQSMQGEAAEIPNEVNTSPVSTNPSLVHELDHETVEPGLAPQLTAEPSTGAIILGDQSVETSIDQVDTTGNVTDSLSFSTVLTTETEKELFGTRLLQRHRQLRSRSIHP